MSKTTTKTTNRRTEANRQNAAKSTGPRTAAGKGRSRLNALKHGLRAEQVVVLGGPNPEDPRDFEDLRDGLIDDRKPAGALEELLVERLAVSFWRLRRAYRFEAESIAQANRVNPVSKMLDELSGLPAPEPVEHLLPKLQNLDRLVRYESMIDRELLRSMALLQRVQQRRKLDEEPSDPFDIAPAGDSRAMASTRTDRRSEAGQGSRIRGVEEMRISDCGLRNEERRQREVEVPSANNTGRSGPRATNSGSVARRGGPWRNESRITSQESRKTSVAERSHRRVTAMPPTGCGAKTHRGARGDARRPACWPEGLLRYGGGLKREPMIQLATCVLRRLRLGVRHEQNRNRNAGDLDAGHSIRRLCYGESEHVRGRGDRLGRYLVHRLR